MSIGTTIAKLREQHGNMSQKALAAQLNINRSVLNRIEKDTRPARNDEIAAIAEFFNVTTDYLMGRDVSSTKKAPAESGEGGQVNIKNTNIDFNLPLDNKYNNVYAVPMYTYSKILLHGEDFYTMPADSTFPIPTIGIPADTLHFLFAVAQDSPFGMIRLGFGPDVAAVTFNPRAPFLNGKYYLLAYNGETLLRRVTKNPDGSYLLESDNGAQTISPEFAQSGNLKIIARAVSKNCIIE